MKARAASDVAELSAAMTMIALHPSCDGALELEQVE